MKINWNNIKIIQSTTTQKKTKSLKLISKILQISLKKTEFSVWKLNVGS
jgi:hypothetical protein